jgi:TorA maturation chaperone TorD
MEVMPPSDEIATQSAHLLPGNWQFLTSILRQQVTVFYSAAADFTEIHFKSKLMEKVEHVAA